MADFDASRAAADQKALVDKARNAVRILSDDIIRPYGQSGPTSEDDALHNKEKMREHVTWVIDELRALMSRL